MPDSTFVGKPFTDWTEDDARAAIDSAVATQVGEDAFEANRAYLEDFDHWQDGDAWVGPRSSDDSVWTSQKEVIARQFTPLGKISECLNRVANSLLKQEPDVAFVALEPAEEGSEEADSQQAATDAMVALISGWWDDKKLWRLARLAVKRARWAVRGSLRVYLPQGSLERSGDGDAVTFTLPSKLSFADALDRLELSAPEPDAAYVYTDPNTRERCAIYHFEESTEEGTEEKYELWFLDGDETVFRIVGGDQDDEEYRVELGGRLPIVEMEADLLVTEVVRAQQRQLDYFNSLSTRVAETGGFPERYTINAEPSGIWLQTPPTHGPALMEKIEGGKNWYLHPAPRTLGAAITTDLRGIPNEDGKLTTPSVVFRDPTDPEFAIKSKRDAVLNILHECHQAHVMMNSDAVASGYSREQARADHEDDLTNTKGPLEGMLRDLLELVIAWASQMSEEFPDFLEDYRCVVNLHVNSGPISPEEQRQNNENVKAGTLSRPSAMAMNGVEDVDAELQRIETDPQSLIDIRTKQMTVITTYVAEGMGWETAAIEAGVEEEERLEVFRELDRRKADEESEEDAQDDEIESVLAGTAGGTR